MACAVFVAIVSCDRVPASFFRRSEYLSRAAIREAVGDQAFSTIGWAKCLSRCTIGFASEQAERRHWTQNVCSKPHGCDPLLFLGSLNQRFDSGRPSSFP